MIDISNKIANKTAREVGSMGIESYIIPQQQDNGMYAPKADDAMKIGESINIHSVGYQRPVDESKKDFSETLMSQASTDAKARQNEMVVASNTMTTEDCGEIEKDGFSVTDSSGKVIVTETDQIMAALARAGVDIMEYGSGLSKEQLDQITGNSAIAYQIQQTMDQASSITDFSQDNTAYLIKNEIEPTVSNLYKALYSSNDMSYSSQKNNMPMTDEDFENMRSQIEDIIEKSGMEVDNRSFEDCCWLISNGIALTTDNLIYMNSLQNYSADSMKVLSAVKQALVEGKAPKDAVIIDGFSLKDKAENALSVIEQATTDDLEYCLENDQEITIENLQAAENIRLYGRERTNSFSRSTDKEAALITAERKLAEVRLSMTAEANYAMLKKGISIDTKPLEELVEELKVQEQQYYRGLLSGSHIDASTENIKAFSDTQQLVEQMKAYPAYAIHRASNQESLQTLHDRGAVLKETLDKANTSYEAMMTVPRADMGDTIAKAFRNVDDILTDLGYETNSENQRAIRILAYNGLELNTENINQIKAVDEEVQRAFKNLTPAVTLEMIRKGIQPLDMNISDLNEVAQELKAQSGENDTERFNKYLWKLEQNSEITQEERSSYIGIYRLIAQVEKGDGAALGAVINQGSDMTMRNLLTAVRTGRKATMDYRVDDSFAGVDGSIKGEKIDDQIMAAYSLNCVRDSMEILSPARAKLLSQIDWQSMTPEQLRDKLEEMGQNQTVLESESAVDELYAREQIKQYQQAASQSEEIYQIMEKYDIENTAENVLATANLVANPGAALKSIFGNKNDSRIKMVQDMKQLILERFGEAVKTPSELAEAQEALAEVAEHAMDGMIIEDSNPNSIDVRELKLACKQLSIAAKEAKSESFVIPVETSDGIVTGISLKIVRGKDKKGMVDIFLETERLGKVSASFEAKADKLSGIIASNSQEGRSFFQERIDEISNLVGMQAEEMVEVNVAFIQDISSEMLEQASLHKKNSEDIQPDSQDYQVQTRRLYGIAESFINYLREIV